MACRKQRACRKHAERIVFSLLVSVFLSSLIAAPSWAAQCAPYARNLSGIDLYGNAWTWWQHANGVYARGNRPVVGAALIFKPKRDMPAGHVAVVTRVLSAREITVDHANWGQRGLRGKVQHGVRVIDVSDNNDWSLVRVWYPPVRDFGSAYDVYGFIYPSRPRLDL
jgi:hypothetical protein